MGETVEEIQEPISPTMATQSDSEESTASTLGLGPGLSGMDLSGDAEGRRGDPRTVKRVGNEGENQENANGEFSCRWGICTESFSHVDLLASHVTCVHATSGEGGLFFCGWRGCSRGKRGFNARYKMLIHVRTHTNEKPHRCPRCDKSFSRAENLKIHARSHTGERPYVCPVPGCGKAYSNSSDRFKHTRTHSVERPYACRVPGCSKRYTDPSSLRKHVKTYAHYHRPAAEENNKGSEDKQATKSNITEQGQDKKLSSNVTVKATEVGKNKTGVTLHKEETRINAWNSKASSPKDVAASSILQDERWLKTKDKFREEAMETEANKRLAPNEFGLGMKNSLELGGLQSHYVKESTSTSWPTIPDDKWLENDIEEVEEEDDEELDRKDYSQSKEQTLMKESHYLSNSGIQSRPTKFTMENEWSSGGEEGWISDESDYVKNGMHKRASPSAAYVNYRPRHNHFAEQQLVSKMNKKNYLLSRSCQKKLDDLILRSVPKFGSSNMLSDKKHYYHTNIFQPMGYSPNSVSHQSSLFYKETEKFTKIISNMAYHSIAFEQVVPLDLRKVSE